jgi:hypothetical protein
VTPPRLAAGLAAHLAAMESLAGRLEGHLTPREARFLALLGAVPTCSGDILEIGSFKGKSTILLAKSAAFAGTGRVAAVDPLSMPASTDPTDALPAELPGIFRANLEQHGVQGLVDFHQMRSGDLGPRWTRALRLLWIDGDHTYQGALADFDSFAAHLHQGAIVAVHDVLNRFDGPVAVMLERILDDDRFGAAGLVGSIGWGQFLGDPSAGRAHAGARRGLADRLRAMVPWIQEGRPQGTMARLRFKAARWRVPHASLTPEAWASLVEAVA